MSKAAEDHIYQVLERETQLPRKACDALAVLLVETLLQENAAIFFVGANEDPLQTDDPLEQELLQITIGFSRFLTPYQQASLAAMLARRMRQLGKKKLEALL